MNIFNTTCAIAFCIFILISCKKEKQNQIALPSNPSQKVVLDKIKSDYILLGGNIDTINYAKNNNDVNKIPLLIKGSNLIKIAETKGEQQFYVLTKTIKSDQAYSIVKDELGYISKYQFAKGTTVTFMWLPEIGAHAHYYLYEVLGWIEPLLLNDTISTLSFASSTNLLQEDDNENLQHYEVATIQSYLFDGYETSKSPISKINETDNKILSEQEENIALK